MFAGHDQPLELVDHLGQQVERLGVLLHAVCDQFCRRHHLVAQVADVVRAVLDAAGHRLNRGPELLHAALLGELGRSRALAEVRLQSFVLRQFRLIAASVVTRSGRVVAHQGATERLVVVFATRFGLPARAGESVNALLTSGSLSCGARRCRVDAEKARPRMRRSPAGGGNVPRLSPRRPLFVQGRGVGQADAVGWDRRRRVGVVITAASSTFFSPVGFGFLCK